MTAGLAEAPHVRFDGVTKSYGAGPLAVKALNLDVRRGEFLTLLGPSGSGKTTALMMLAGFEQPSSGQILLAGRRIDRTPPNRRDIGLVFQNYALFPHMTVAENLAYPLKVRRMAKAEIAARVARMLEMVQLPGLGGRRPDQLSGGQQQRVAVARALIFQPSLVLMDEPLGALDKQLREQMQFELKAIHDRLGVTFVYVTHDQTEALTMSDRIAVFAAGEVQQVATPAELYERPATSFVAGFVGENNRLTGRLVSLSGETGAVALDGGPRLPAGVAPGLAVGDAVLLSIRPERLRLLGPGETRPAELGARLRQAIYVGDHLRLLAEGPGGQEIVIKLAPGGGLPDLTPGRDLRLGWEIAEGRALKP